jgi:catechol 2,3-dioxygenase-like lactoylglutathione lyase family enzyme
MLAAASFRGAAMRGPVKAMNTKQTTTTKPLFASAFVAPTLPVVDVGLAKRFYGQTLGLRLVHENAEEIMYELEGDSRLLLYPRPTPTRADNTACCFRVTDVDETVAALRARGVVFEEYDLPHVKTTNGVATTDWNRCAWFKDPDGNILAVVESLA